jgi:hypothetical protein
MGGGLMDVDHINNDLRDDHCQGTFCNSMSVPDPDNEPYRACECGCGSCCHAKGRGMERLPRAEPD